jgi:flagellar P-ring protein precursor FlgI
MAQGNVIVGGAGASAGGSRVLINHLSAGRVPGGATVERAVPSPALTGDSVRLELSQTDFTMAGKVAEAINKVLGRGGAAPLAQALDARVIQVRLPVDPAARVPFLAQLENVDVAQALPSPKVVVNARTGSVVMNQTVTLEPSAVAHGNLSVTITSTPVISQPGPLSQGQTVVAEKADIQIRQEGGALMRLEAAAKLTDVIKALNALGATSGDLIAILQALKAAGSLRAELEII